MHRGRSILRSSSGVHHFLIIDFGSFHIGLELESVSLIFIFTTLYHDILTVIVVIGRILMGPALRKDVNMLIWYMLFLV